MARYLLVAVDDNARAEALRGKIDAVAGMTTLGVFGRPTKFCECPPVPPAEMKSTLGKKYNWRVCPDCRRPRRGTFQHLRNLLDPENLPAKFLNVFIQIKEPYAAPLEEYGEEAIERQRQHVEAAWSKVSRGVSRRARRQNRRKRA